MINDTLGLGRVGKYIRFRSHMLRKFHASALYNGDMILDKVNDLQRKAKNKFTVVEKTEHVKAISWTIPNI